MSRENVEAVIAMYADFSELARGADVAAYVAAHYEPGVATEITLREVHAAADQLVAVVTVAGRTRESGVPYEHTWGYVCEVDADRLTYFRAHFDPNEALHAAGLSE